MNNKAIIALVMIVSIFSCVAILHQIYATRIPPPQIPKYSPAIPEYGNMMLLFVFFYMAYLIEALCQKYDVPTPYGGFIVILSFFWGVTAFYYPVLRLISKIAYLPAEHVMFLYIPAVMFKLSFCVDVPTFLKTLPQILTMGTLAAYATSSLFAVFSIFIINYNWPIRYGVLLGIFCLPNHPHIITNLLKQHSTRTKQISVLLEGEALITFFFADIAHRVVIGYREEVVVYWYQFVAITLRVLIFGLFAGYVMGAISRYLIRKMCTNRTSVFIMCLGLPFFTYFFSELYISGCGSITVMVLGLMLSKERTIFPKEIGKFLTDVWGTAAYMMEVVVCTKIGMMSALMTTQPNWSQYSLIIVTYLIYYISRLISYIVFSPIISRVGYGMDFKNMIVCVWGDMKSPFSLNIIGVFIERDKNKKAATTLLFNTLGLYLLSVFINGSFTMTILDILGFTQISLERQLNMNSCMRHIFMKRNRTIAVLKMDRFLADTNWPVVNEATNMKHPYKMGLINEEEGAVSSGYRFTHCGDCNKDIPQEPSVKEMKEMMKEAKLRVLKAKKMTYARLYENGMMTTEAMRILTQAVELAIDSEDAEIRVQDLYNRFSKENWFVRCLRRRADALRRKKERKYKPPRTYWRRICYHWVVKNTIFDKIMMIIIFIHVLLIAPILIYRPKLIIWQDDHISYYYDVVEPLFAAANTIFAGIYFVEFVIKILAYSSTSVMRDGCRTYFTSLWNVTDFMVMIACFFRALTRVTRLSLGYPVTPKLFRQINDVFYLLRAIRLLQMYEIFYPDIIRYLDKVFDTKLVLTYELGKSYTTGESEILEMLPYLIDNYKIRQEIKIKAESDRLLITKLIGIVQKERPWIAITVKTTQAIRTVINSMKDALDELKSAGWVDAYEYEKILIRIDELSKKVNSIKRVQPSPPKVIFKEVAWMAGDETVIEFLFQNVVVKNFQPGEVIFGDGNIADGIYIVVTGLFMFTYLPNNTILNNLREYGQLPIVDYMSAGKFEEPFVDYIVSGNCIGELSTLTERPYNCQIVADVHSQVYVLSRSVLTKAMELSPDSTKGLECRIWKAVGVRLAMPVLLAVPAYQNLSQDLIKYALERSFVPDISKFKVFAVTNLIEDIILIEGRVTDYNTGQVFIAPCWIPRTVQKLSLPTRKSLLKLPTPVKTKLLIIPAKNVDEYDVMALAAETCELVQSVSTTKCLQHTAQTRITHERAARKQRLLSVTASTIWRRRCSPRVAALPLPDLSFIESVSKSESTSCFTIEPQDSVPEKVPVDDKLGFSPMVGKLEDEEEFIQDTDFDTSDTKEKKAM